MLYKYIAPVSYTHLDVYKRQVYAELPGWKADMTKMTSEDEFPEEFNAYVTFLEEQLETCLLYTSRCV